MFEEFVNSAYSDTSSIDSSSSSSITASNETITSYSQFLTESADDLSDSEELQDDVTFPLPPSNETCTVITNKPLESESEDMNKKKNGTSLKSGEVGSKGSGSFIKGSTSFFSSSSFDGKMRKFASALEKVLQSFESIQEWADITSFLLKFSKLLHSYPNGGPPFSFSNQVLIGKRLSQCLNPSLPSGVHLKALEAYSILFQKIDLPSEFYVYSHGILPFFKYASLAAKNYFVGLLGKISNILSPLIQSILPGLEEDANEFFDQIFDLLLLLKSIAGDVAFSDAIWDAILDAPCQRLSVFNLIQHLNSSRPTSGSILLEPQHKAIIAIGEAMLDFNPLVVRFALEFVFRNIPLEESSLISLNDRLYLVRQMLMILLHKDISLSRRVYSWLSPLNVSANTFHIGTTSSFPIKLVLNVLDSMVVELFDPNSSFTRLESARKAHRFFKILISLLDKEELCESICSHLLLPIISGLSKTTFLIEESLMFFELLDVNLIWKILQTSIVEDNLICSLEIIDFALNSIKWICDDECVNVILPPFFLSVLGLLKKKLCSTIELRQDKQMERSHMYEIAYDQKNGLIGNIDFEKVSLLITSLRILESISTKIPIRCLEVNFSSSQAPFAQEILSILLPIQQNLMLSKKDSFNDAEIEIELLTLEHDLHSLNDQMESLQRLIEWVSLQSLFFGPQEQMNLNAMGCLCGCIDSNNPVYNPSHHLPLDLVHFKMLAAYCLEYSLVISESKHHPSAMIILSSLRILISLWRFLPNKADYVKILNRHISYYWASLISLPANNATKEKSDLWKACYAALWTFSHLCSSNYLLQTSTPKIITSGELIFEDMTSVRKTFVDVTKCGVSSNDPATEVNTNPNQPGSTEIFPESFSSIYDPNLSTFDHYCLPSLQGHIISALDLLLSRYLNDPEAFDKEKRAIDIIDFWCYQPLYFNNARDSIDKFSLLDLSVGFLFSLGSNAPTIRFSLSEFSLPWTIFSLLENKSGDLLLSRSLTSTSSFAAERLFGTMFSYLEHVFYQCSQLDSLLKRNLGHSTTDGIASKQSMYNLFPASTSDCINDNTQKLSGNDLLGFSSPMAFNILERLENLLSHATINGFSLLQILNGDHVCFSALSSISPSTTAQQLNENAKCCSNRMIVRFISILSNISTIYLNEAKWCSKINERVTPLLSFPTDSISILSVSIPTLRLTSLRIGLQMISQASHLNGFLKCPCVKDVVSDWVSRLTSFVFRNIDGDRSQGSPVANIITKSYSPSLFNSQEETLASLSAIHFLCSIIPDIPLPLVFGHGITSESINILTKGLLQQDNIQVPLNPMISLLLFWLNDEIGDVPFPATSCHSLDIEISNDYGKDHLIDKDPWVPANDTRTISSNTIKLKGQNNFSSCNDLLNLCFAFWCGSAVCRWLVFLPLLYYLSMAKRKNEISSFLFWRIVDMLTGGYLLQSTLKYLSISTLLPSLLSEIDDLQSYKSIESDLLLLHFVRSFLTKSFSTSTMWPTEIIPCPKLAPKETIGTKSSHRGMTNIPLHLIYLALVSIINKEKTLTRSLSFLSLPTPFWIICLVLYGEKDPSFISHIVTCLFFFNDELRVNSPCSSVCFSDCLKATSSITHVQDQISSSPIRTLSTESSVQIKPLFTPIQASPPSISPQLESISPSTKGSRFENTRMTIFSTGSPSTIIELIMGLVELYKDLFFLSHKNSLLHAALGPGSKNSNILTPLTEPSILGLIEVVLQSVVNHSHQINKIASPFFYLNDLIDRSTVAEKIISSYQSMNKENRSSSPSCNSKNIPNLNGTLIDRTSALSGLMSAFISIWGTSSSGLFWLCKEILINSLLKRKSSSGSCAIGLLKILSILLCGMKLVKKVHSSTLSSADWRYTVKGIASQTIESHQRKHSDEIEMKMTKESISKVIKEASDLFSRVFEYILTSTFKNYINGPMLESILLSEMVLENILLDSGLTSSSELDMDALVTILMNNCLMPAIKNSLSALQKKPVSQWNAFSCAGGRCAGHSGCLGRILTSDNITTEHAIATIDDIRPISSKIQSYSNSTKVPRVKALFWCSQRQWKTCAMEGSTPATELHMYLSIALMLLQKFSHSVTASWRREMLEMLFLDTTLRFFALPLWHGTEDGNRCYCLRRAIVSIITSSLASSYNGDGNSAEIFYTGALGRKSSSALGFFSILSGRIGSSSSAIIESEIMNASSLMTTKANSSSASETSTISLSTTTPTTITTVRRLAYALLVQGPLMSTALSQIHEKVSELFRVIRTMDYYHTISPSGDVKESVVNIPSATCASMLFSSLLMLFRVLVLRFGLPHHFNSLSATTQDANIGVNSTSAVIQNNLTSAIFSWWPTLNAELLLYTGKILSYFQSRTFKGPSPRGYESNVKNTSKSLSQHRLFRRQFRSKDTGSNVKDNIKDIQSSKSIDSSITTTVNENGIDHQHHGSFLSTTSNSTCNINLSTPLGITSTDQANTTGKSNGKTSSPGYNSLIVSDLVSICKLVEFLLNCNVEEIHLHSWWLFGPTGSLAQLWPFLHTEEEFADTKELQTSQKIDPSVNPSGLLCADYVPNNNNSKGIFNEGNDSSLFDKCKASLTYLGNNPDIGRLVSFLRSTEKYSNEKRATFRTSSFQHIFLANIEYEALEEEFSLLEGVGLDSSTF